MFSKIITALVLLFLILPVLIIIPMSFSSAPYMSFPPPGFSLQWYDKFFNDPEWISALVQSLEVGISTTILSLVLGILTALAISRGHFKGKQVLQYFLLLPMIVPTIILAIAIYSFQAKTGLIGTTLGLIIAHTIMATPFVIVTVLSSLSSINPNLEFAASNLGAGPVRTFFQVVLPIIKPAVASGGLFAFITSFDEIVVTLFICGVDVTTLPKKMWDGVRSQIDPTISAIASILIVIIVSILLGSHFIGLHKSKKRSA